MSLSSQAEPFIVAFIAMMGFAVVGMIAAILIPKNIGQSINSSQPTKKSSKAK
jgi:hypothetical protein